MQIIGSDAINLQHLELKNNYESIVFTERTILLGIRISIMYDLDSKKGRFDSSYRKLFEQYHIAMHCARVRYLGMMIQTFTCFLLFV